MTKNSRNLFEPQVSARNGIQFFPALPALPLSRSIDWEEAAGLSVAV